MLLLACGLWGMVPAFFGFVVLTINLNPQSARSQLIRPNHVYESLISGVHDYFNNTCILLLHATMDPTSSKGTKNATLLRDLQMYFSQKRYTRTSIIDLDTFSTKIGANYYRIKRPLFVILNDQEDVRNFLTSVSTWITMAYPTWLIFFSDETKASEFFSRINVPFDCEFIVSQKNGSVEVLTEVYRVAPGDLLRTLPFATWTPAGGIRTTSLTFYQRRDNLFGQTLRVTSIENPPMSTIVTNDRGEMIGVGGFFGRFLEILKEGMNCTFQYTESKAWGSLSPNGSWNGMIGLLNDRKVDLAASEMLITTQRTEVVDFTIPIVTSRFHTYIKRPSFSVVKWKVYTAPFASSIWLAIGSLIILSSGIIVATEYITGSTYHPHDGNSEKPKFAKAAFAIFGALCGQGMLPSPVSTARTVHLAIHLTSVVLLAAYSGALVSFLAIQVFTMPFTTMEGLLKDGTYSFGVVPHSAEYNLFSNTTDRVLRALFEEKLEYVQQLPRNYLEGLRRVCGHDGYGFMVTDTMVSALENRVDCILEALETMLQTSLAMAVPKNSPYRGIINDNILMMRDGGILKRNMESEWPMKFAKHANTEWTSVEFGDVVPLLILLMCGIILASIVACAERFITCQSHSPMGKKLQLRKS